MLYERKIYMLKKEREKEIINILRESNGYATVKSLCSKIYASESSIRRALSSLEDSGIINRIYGGAELIGDFSNVLDFKKRAFRNSSEKIAIAKKAAKLINDGNVLFLDQSSTAFYLALEIADRKNITIATNNIEIISALAPGKINLISSGGTLSRENRTCLIGTDASAAFGNILADYVFFSAKAVSEAGIYDCTREETAVRQSMLKNAKKKIFLCDSEKIGTCAPYRQCGIDEIDFIVCEKEIHAPYFAEYKNLQIL